MTARDTMAGLSAALALALALASLSGCKEDACRGLPPSFQMDLVAGPGVRAPGEGQLEIVIKVLDPATPTKVLLTKKSTAPLSDQLDDYRTSFVVQLGDRGAAGFLVNVDVALRGAQQRILARAEAQFSGSGDGCNLFSMVLWPWPDDAGVDAPPQPDRGPDSARDAAPDRALPDLPLPDQALPDQAQPDAGTPCAAASAHCSADNWCWDHPRWGGSDINHLWGTSSSQVFGVGDHGTIRRFDGTSWSNDKSPTSARLNAVWGSSASDVYAAGHGGAVLRLGKGGWKSLSTGFSADVRGIWGSSASDVYFVGAGGLIQHFDGQGTWTARASGVTTALEGIWGSGASDVWAVGQHGVMLHYDGNAAKTWTSHGTSIFPWSLRAIWGRHASEVFVVGDVGHAYRYDGLKWTQMTTNSTWSMHAIWGSGTQLVAAGDTGLLLRLDAASAGSWAAVASGHNIGIRGVWGQGPSAVYLAGDVGSVLRYTTSGSSHKVEPVTNLHPRRLYGVWGSGPSDVWAVGEQGSILRREAAGWKVQVSPSNKHLHAVWGRGPTEVYAASTTGQVLVGGGAGWKVQAKPTAVKLNAIWGTASELIIAGNSNVVLSQHLGKWAELFKYGLLKPHFTGVWGSGPTDIYLVGDWGNVWRSKYNSGSGKLQWIQVPGFAGNVHFRGVWVLGPTEQYAVGTKGLNKPALFRGYNGVWSSVVITTKSTLQGVWGSGASAIYAVGDSGTVLNFAGKAWTQQQSGTSAHLTHVWGAGTHSVYAVGHGGAILRRCGP